VQFDRPSRWAWAFASSPGDICADATVTDRKMLAVVKKVLIFFRIIINCFELLDPDTKLA
jgi:hypothetical protein